MNVVCLLGRCLSFGSFRSFGLNPRGYVKGIHVFVIDFLDHLQTKVGVVSFPES